MKDNRITIQIETPVQKLFEYTINPKNTPKWIESIVKEETNEWPVRIGTVYKNQNKLGKWSEYSVADLKTNEIFKLVSKDKNYHVRYTYISLGKNTSTLEYYEWVDKGEIEEPFSQEVLKKLKLLLERR